MPSQKCFICSNFRSYFLKCFLLRTFLFLQLTPPCSWSYGTLHTDSFDILTLSNYRPYFKNLEIKNKLTVTRGEVGRGSWWGKREGFSGTTIKDTWTKLKGGGIRGGRWGWLEWSGGGKVRQLYLNSNKIKIKLN